MKHFEMIFKNSAQRLVVALLCMSLGTAYAATQATYYVSPSGSDLNPGTQTQPFQTIAKAKSVVRSVNSSMTGDVVVTLRGGTYPLTNTLAFSNADGGTNGFYVRYVNYPGETPLLTGGQPITGWTLYDQGKNIWKASGVNSQFRQLYVNGTKAVRARFPNLNADGSANFDRLTKVDTTGRALDVASSYVSNWSNFSKVEMHLMIAWADATLRLASSTTSGSTTKLQIQDPEKTMLFNRPYPMLGATLTSRWYGDGTQQQCFFFENAYEFIDQPGEWYLNDSTKTLYYMPRSGENMATATVVAPILENLLTITGTSTTQAVSHLAFQGLVFAHASFMRPSNMGFLDLQAGQFNVAAPGGNNYMLWRPAAGVTVTNADHILFDGNVFAQMAATGLDFISGTHDDKIEGNVFADLGGAGISLGKFAQDSLTEVHIAYNPSDKNETCTRDTIENNLVTHVTTEIQGAVGIVAGYPRYLKIDHNEVSYTNYTGISVGFGWTTNATAMTNNTINSNNIHHVVQLLADGGPIYTLSNQGSGDSIDYNYIHDITASQWADYWIVSIYLDEGTSGYDVSHNVFSNSPTGVACNSCGTYTATDNDGSSATTISSAGIDAAHVGIKNKLPIPIPNFAAPVPQSPYQGITAQIPGTVQAENYDLGGQGVAYFVNDSLNHGGIYRTDDISIGFDSATSDYFVGWTSNGEWLDYTVNVADSGKYNYTARVASAVSSGRFSLTLDGTVISEPLAVPNTGAWSTFTTVQGTTTSLPSGKHTLQLMIDSAYLNIDWVAFAKADSSSPVAIKTPINSQQNGQSANVYDLSGKFIGALSQMNPAHLRDQVASIAPKNGVYIVKNPQGITYKLSLMK